MSGRHLCDQHLSTFLANLVNLDVHIPFVIGDKFTIAFPLHTEDETGNVLKEPTYSIITTAKTFEKCWPGVKISVTMTSPANFFASLSDDEAMDIFEQYFDGGDNSYRHDFYVFVTMVTK
jgi:hypothetical protein